MRGGEADRPGTVLTEEILGEDNTGTLMCPRETHVAQAGWGWELVGSGHSVKAGSRLP